MSDELKKKLSDLTWRGEHWGKDGSLVLSNQLAEQGVITQITLASTYYSAAGAAKAKSDAAKSRIAKLKWLVRGFLLLKKAVRIVDAYALETERRDITTDELDVMASILSKARLPRRTADARSFISHALMRENATPGTRVLLYCTQAEIMMGQGNVEDAAVAFDQAAMIVQDYDIGPQKVVRYYRARGRFEKWRGSPKSVSDTEFLMALEIATQNKLDDQIDKIRAEMQA